MPPSAKTAITSGPGPKYWLLKSEPSAFSWDDLWAAKGRITTWDGVRNFTARNFLRDEMRRGDPVFFYHSSAAPPAIMGIAEVVREGYPDPSAFDPKDSHYDPKSRPDAPSWFMVDIRAVEPLKRPLPLDELRTVRGLEKMMLLQRGSRLSVQPVRPEEWARILAVASAPRRAE